MRIRKLISVAGAAITTFLLVAVAVIEALAMEFSALVGLPLGVLAGVALSMGLWARWDTVGRQWRTAASAYAAFGTTLLVLSGLQYVNVGSAILTFPVVVGASLVSVVVVFVALTLTDAGATP